MNKSVIIRSERPDDARAVENLVREAFWNVYRPGCLEHYVLHRLTFGGSCGEGRDPAHSLALPKGRPAPRMATTNRQRIPFRFVKIRVNSWPTTSGWAESAWGCGDRRTQICVEAPHRVRAWGEAVSWFDETRSGFRVARRARSCPMARGADGFRGRGRRTPDMRSVALRANTKRRFAPFTKARWRGTRKRPGRPSRHETASLRP